MKLVRYADHDAIKVGVVKGDGVIDLRKHLPAVPDDTIALIGRWRELRSGISRLADDVAPDAALDKVRLLAPVARPGK